MESRLWPSPDRPVARQPPKRTSSWPRELDPTTTSSVAWILAKNLVASSMSLALHNSVDRLHRTSSEKSNIMESDQPICSKAIGRRHQRLDPTEVRSWQPLSRRQRRVAGVLVEKSKTTPDVYPMSLNGIKTAANQKSNRQSQDGPGRAPGRRDAVRAAQDGRGDRSAFWGAASRSSSTSFMTGWGSTRRSWPCWRSCCLRGEQTLGELTGSRRENGEGDCWLGGVASHLRQLAGKRPGGRVVSCQAEGRSSRTTLYQSDELDRLRRDAGSGSPVSPSLPTVSSVSGNASPADDAPAVVPVSQGDSRITDLERRLVALEQEMADLKRQLLS
jgi:uncharacterized protein YceH (UPF0502 family)